MKPSRRRFLEMAAALPATVAVGKEVEAQKQAGASSGPKKPNVLILLSDQHRRDLLTCSGNPLVPTPNLDRIAARGVRFTQAYCPYPVCAPSRMSLLTGLHGHHHGVDSNERTLDWRVRTVAHHFRDHGYLTGLIGKMHFNDGHTHGFDYVLGFNDWLMYLGPKVQHYANEIGTYSKTMHNTGCGFPAIEGLWKGASPWVGHVTARTELASDLAAEDHFDFFVGRESSKFLRRYKEQPFFLIAGFLKPHFPFYPPKGWAERYVPEKIDFPSPGDLTKYPRHVRERAAAYRKWGEDQLRRFWAGYLGNLAFLDSCIGEVYRTLEELNLTDDTIVLYTSDHGEMGGEHGLFEKFVFFEPSVGVPFIVSCPKMIPEGKVRRALTEYLGIYPTLAELTGTGRPTGLDARSFAPLLRNPEAPGPAAIFAEYALSWAPRYMIRTPRFKYVYNEGDVPELYDLEADPGEFINQADSSDLSHVRKRLHEQLLAWYDPDRNPRRPQARDFAGKKD